MGLSPQTFFKSCWLLLLSKKCCPSILHVESLLPIVMPLQNVGCLCLIIPIADRPFHFKIAALVLKNVASIIQNVNAPVDGTLQL